MSEPFIAEVKIFAGTFAPRGWAYCDGQLLPISQNTALFSLVGTIYGGDGRSTFGLPDLQGRAAMHPGNGPGLTNRRLGQKGGSTDVPLAQDQMPAHSHATLASDQMANASDPVNRRFADTGTHRRYGPATDLEDLNALVVDNTGSSEGHNNMQPFLTLGFIIALVGTYPSR